MRIKKFLLLFLVPLFLFTGCAKTETADDGRLSIVATNFAMYDFARAAAGNSCHVTMLLPPGSESHDFEASLTDIARISEADVFVCVGSEDWVDDAWQAMGSLADGITVIRAMDTVLHHGTDFVSAELCPVEHDHDHDHDHEHSADMDEHVWMSVGNAKAIMNEIADAVIALDPSLEQQVTADRDLYFSLLDPVDAHLYELAQKTDKKLVVADRFPFAYLTQRYGFAYEAAFTGCTSDTEPTLAVINTLIETVKNEKIPVIFVTEGSDRKTAEAVAEETGAEIRVLYSSQSVTKEEFENGATYAYFMQKNLAALNEALGE